MLYVSKHKKEPLLLLKIRGSCLFLDVLYYRHFRDRVTDFRSRMLAFRGAGGEPPRR